MKSLQNKAKRKCYVLGTFFVQKPTGTQILSASDDSTIRVWEKEGDDWVTKFVLQGHTNSVFSLTTIQTPTGTQILSASDDSTVRVWEPTNF